MTILLSLAGGVLLVIVMVDILLTMVGANRSSPIAMRVGRMIFSVFRRFPDYDFKHLMMGPAVVTVVASYWVISLAVAWTLIFLGSAADIELQTEATGSEPLGILAHIGHLLSTVGGGLSQPESTLSALLGVLVGVNGMVVLTLSVSFVLGTTRTVVAGRRLFLLMDLRETADVFDDQKILDEMVGFLARLNASPLTLFFSHPDRSMRIVDRLSDALRTSESEPGGPTETLVDTLPGIPRGDGQTPNERLAEWADRYRPSKKVFAL